MFVGVDTNARALTTLRISNDKALVPQLFFGTALSWPSQICKRTTNVVESLIEYPYARTISTGQ